MSDAKRKKIKFSKKEEVNKNNNSCCYLCGEKINIYKDDPTNWNIDHLLPIALLKWLPESKELGKLEEDIHSDKNLAIVHKRCNVIRDMKIITPDEFDKNKHSSNILKDNYREIYEKNKSLIKAFINLVKDVLQKQGNVCYGCGKPLSLKKATIRRIDDSLPRTIDNACCVCSNCNVHKKIFRKKS